MIILRLQTRVKHKQTHCNKRGRWKDSTTWQQNLEEKMHFVVTERSQEIDVKMKIAHNYS